VSLGCFLGGIRGEEVWVGPIDFQMTFWGPEKKVQGKITWFVFKNDLGAILNL